jgi:hypothetical protein
MKHVYNYNEPSYIKCVRSYNDPLIIAFVLRKKANFRHAAMLLL